MILDNDLNEKNFLLYAMKEYNNPQCIDIEEFNDDLRKIKYIKRLFNQYASEGVLKERLLLNHIIIFYNVVTQDYTNNIVIASWIKSGSLEINWAINIDALSSVMLVVVTLISSIVHIYSIGYMSHDPHKPRFMAFLSLFTFAMLTLVTSDNFLQLFFGWEGVGLCSYFLIGFWF